MNKSFDICIIGAGPGGIYCAFELVSKNPNIKIAVFEKGNELEKRECPSAEKNQNCFNCSICSITNGFGGAGAFSDGKFTMTTEYGGNLSSYIGKEQTLPLMQYVDEQNKTFSNESLPEIYESDETSLKQELLKTDLHLLKSKIRHLGTDLNYSILSHLYWFLLEHNVEFYFNTEIIDVLPSKDSIGYDCIDKKQNTYHCSYCIISVGRSGGSWVKKLCDALSIPYKSDKIDIGVRVELPYEVFRHITDQVYESKIVYKTSLYQDRVRTFCMNPRGYVVTEKSEGVMTVNGHSYDNPCFFSDNTNFALLVNKSLTEPFNDSTSYAKSIASLSNMIGGGVLVQRFGDLIRGQRTTEERLKKSFVTPTLNATPGDLSLVMPKRILDDIIEMIYQLHVIAPGTANDDTLLYGVEVKFYNVTVDVNENLETKSYPGLYIIGDGSGVTHSLAQASASGVFVARNIHKKIN